MLDVSTCFVIKGYSTTSIVRIKCIIGVFEISNNPDYWISNKTFEFLEKITYLKELFLLLICKQRTEPADSQLHAGTMTTESALRLSLSRETGLLTHINVFLKN
jgi:hypothetical protein